MKMMHGALLRPCSNMSRTRLAPTPTNISTKSEPEMLKNGTSASPATALASRVLPVPGGPTIRMPFGILPPILVNFFGSLRKSTTSLTSSLASSQPATSANVSLSRSRVRSLARLLPKLSAPLPACRSWRMKRKYSRPMIRRNGITFTAIWESSVVAGCSAKAWDFCRRSMLASVRRPAARNCVVGPRSPSSPDSFAVSPVITTQSRPPEASGRITPSFTLPCSANSTTFWILTDAGVVRRPGAKNSSAIAASTITSQITSILGWKRSGGRFLSERRFLGLSESGMENGTEGPRWMFPPISQLAPRWNWRVFP